MRIVIDMQGAQGASRDRGIGRYTLSLVREFLRGSAGHEIFLLFNGNLPAQQEIRDELHGLYKPENQRVWFSEGPFSAHDQNNAVRRELAEIIWEAAVAALQPDFVLITSMFEGFGDDAVAPVPVERDYGVAAILYDLIPLLYHNIYLADERHRHHYQLQLERLKQCDLLLAISAASARDARHLLKLPADRIATIGAAIDDDFASRHHQVTERLAGLNRPYLLYVSGGDERKNQKRLLAAFAGIPASTRSGYQLVIAGSLPDAIVADLLDHARSLELEDGEVVFAPYIDDAMLHLLYSECLASVFPSWHEGFGLPVLEAMAFGKAVVGSNCSSIPEIIRDPEALFDPFDAAAIREVLVRLLTDHKFRRKLERDAAEIVPQFSWIQVATKARDAIASAEAKPRDAARKAAIGAIAAIRASAILDEVSTDSVGGHLAATLRPDPRRQLLLDISELVQRDARTGIQRVVRAILGSLLDHTPEGWVVEPVYAVHGESGFRHARAYLDRYCGMAEPWHKDGPVQVWPGDVFCALDLNHGVLLAQQNLLASWRRRGVAIWTVVYDILPLRLPDFFPDGLEALHGEWVRCLAGFDGAMCISKAVADDLMAWVAEEEIATAPHFKANWFHLGADILETAPSRGLPENAQEVLAKLADLPSVLMVGTVEPRKGHGQALAAVEALWEAGVDLNLVIVGKEGWHVEDIAKRLRRHSEAGRRLFWLDGISDEFLDQVYQSCHLLLAPSEGEGFGLPLIEAAQKGIPLLVRDIPVFREVAGPAADYFPNTRDPAAIATALQAWLAKSPKGKATSLAWLTWDESAAQFFRRMTE